MRILKKSEDRQLRGIENSGGVHDRDGKQVRKSRELMKTQKDGL